MNCKNCNRTLTNEDQFCNNCGGRVVTDPLTYRYLASEFNDRFFDFENNLLIRTIKDLFTRPEEVIEGYINGVRKRHISVASYLALAITVAGIQLYLMQKYFQENMDMSWMAQEKNPLIEDPTFFDFIWEYQSLLYVILIPLYAFLAKLTFFNYKKFNYLHQIVIMTYTQAHMSIALSVPLLIGLLMGVNFFKLVYFFSFPFMIIYTAYCYKRLYRVSLGKIIGKTMLFIFGGGFIYFMVWIGIFIILMATGVIDFEQFREAQKAQQEVGYIASSVINWTS